MPCGQQFGGEPTGRSGGQRAVVLWVTHLPPLKELPAGQSQPPPALGTMPGLQATWSCRHAPFSKCEPCGQQFGYAPTGRSAGQWPLPCTQAPCVPTACVPLGQQFGGEPTGRSVGHCCVAVTWVHLPLWKVVPAGQLQPPSPLGTMPSRQIIGVGCAFRRSRPGIPSEGGHPFQLKPAGDSDDPGHLSGLAPASTFASGHSTGSASSF
jgi:hypothetical protein